MKLTKEQILEKISEKDIFDHFLQPYHEGAALKPGQNISNPLLPEKQKTPSFNIYERNGKWKFKDFSTGDNGDCWNLVMRLKKIDFKGTLELISNEFMFNEKSKTTILDRKKNGIKKPLLFNRSFNTQEKEFWKKYGINEDTLKTYKVNAVTNYIAYNKDGEQYEVKNQNDALMYSYDYGNCYKIYKPNDKTNRFVYLGERDQNFFFGINQLPKNGNNIFITGGEKDVMTLHAHGYSAICMNSETATIPESLISNLKTRFEQVIVLYDNDETGLKQSEKIAQQHDIVQLILPEIPNNGKDISDFFLNGSTKTDFEALIENIHKVAKFAKSAKSANLVDDIANIVDFADFADSQNKLTQEQLEVESKDILSTTPCIDESVYSQLPSFLGPSCDMFDSPREKDVFLTSVLGVLSGCMPDFFGVYHNNPVRANLYTFVVAPSGNGKGVMNKARDMGLKYHRYLYEKSREAIKKYEKEARDKQKSKSDDHDSTEINEKPGLELYFIPANSSSSRIYKHIADNPNGGVICETEADTLGQILKKEWGSFSDLLRKLYAHEMSSQSRILNDQYIEIINGKLSVVLSGTPNQVLNIISDAEDGLFSRFIFYLFKSKPVWKSPRPDPSRENYSDFFNSRAEDMFELVQFYKERPAEMTYTIDQWDLLDQTFQIYLSRIIRIIEGDVEGVVYRLGLIHFRICMILTALRNFEGRFHREIMDCHPTDFDTASKILRTYIEHSLIMMENLPRSSKHSIVKRPKNIDSLFDNLPSSFTRKEAVEKAPNYGISTRTVDEYLKREKGRSLHSPKAGVYEKVQDDIQ